MNELKIFENKEFGEIRTVEVNGEPYFVAKDIATALGYKDTINAIKTHCRWVAKHHLPHPQSPSKTIEVNVIPEGDLYRLIAHSELPSAKKFESWIYDEVLPALRKTGTYFIPKKQPKRSGLPSINMAATILRNTYKEAGVDPMYIAVAIDNLYKTEAGIDFGIKLTANQERLYDCTEIANLLGIRSKNGKPHDKAISAIIQKLDIADSDKIITPFVRNGHSDVTVQYSQNVFRSVKQWIVDHQYPTVIQHERLNGKMNQYQITYQK